MPHTKWKQGFYAEVKPIAMLEPLASILGAIEDDEPVYYSYQDCVKLAGHACASVSTAFQMTRLALKALYGSELPVRGSLEVRFAGAREAGANGPIGQVIQFLTGAAIETGFHGLGGRYSRANLFTYDDGFDGGQGLTVEFKRIDTGKKIAIHADPSFIPATEEERLYSTYMPQVIHGSATAEEREKFYVYWQGKNKKILLEDHPGVFTITDISD
ncbi:hypothetical protein MNBD_NITROSPINAE02-718 [hydrothermal vent metagenome]|uniref:Formylmethanofuran dehydrogenase subunit E domain-containing protein n=1 Tax=hydrothermal vent metagenome TaxID=652676 RepID=A0A3B1CF44_9ZZZZ